MDEQREVERATVEVLGALAYGQLRAFAAAARVVSLAPDTGLADALAGHAVAEHTAYAALRDHLAGLTDDAAAAMERQRAPFDDFFDQVALDDWFDACTFFATGLPIAADFSRALGPALAPATAEVVVAALADRAPFEAFAIEQLRTLLVDDATRERARRLAADVLGRALTSYQGAMAATDALRVLVAADAAAQGISSEARVKHLAMTVLDGHRRRVVALALEDLDLL